MVREAIETRLTIAEQSSKNLDGWTEDALRAEIQRGLDDLANGHYTEHDDTTLADLFEDIKTRAVRTWIPSSNAVTNGTLPPCPPRRD